MQLSISVIKPLKVSSDRFCDLYNAKMKKQKWQNCKQIGLIWGRLQHYSSKQDDSVPASADICINCVYNVLRL